MRLSAFDCLRRGWTNLSANWELVVIQWLESSLIALLLAVGVVLASLSAGMNALVLGRGTARQIEQALQHLVGSPALPWAGVTLMAIWLATLLVHCFFQAATYGVLSAADRQALPGPRRHRDFFRAFSLRDFAGWGGLYVWRYLGLRVLFWGLLLLAALAGLLWLVLIGVGGGTWGTSAAFGIGCGGALPLAFLALVLGLWLNVVQADLAREGSGLRSASRRALDVLGRRLGAVIALAILFGVTALLVVAVFVRLSLGAREWLAGAPPIRPFVQFLLVLLQTIPSTLLAMLLAGSLVALVRSETRRPEAQPA
jgi:hypothetical protein